MLPSSNSLATLAHLTLSSFSHLTNTTLSLFSLSLSLILLSHLTFAPPSIIPLSYTIPFSQPLAYFLLPYNLSLTSLCHPLSHLTFSPHPTFSSHSLITLFLPHFFIPSVTPLYYTTLSTYYLITLYHPILLPPL